MLSTYSSFCSFNTINRITHSVILLFCRLIVLFKLRILDERNVYSRLFFVFGVFFEEPDEGLLFKLYSLREETSKSQEEPDHRDEISQEQLGEDAVVEVASVGWMSED